MALVPLEVLSLGLVVGVESVQLRVAGVAQPSVAPDYVGEGHHRKYGVEDLIKAL